MDLAQATGVILGANIGTTVTGQIVALQLTDYAPLAVFRRCPAAFCEKTLHKAYR